MADFSQFATVTTPSGVFQTNPGTTAPSVDVVWSPSGQDEKAYYDSLFQLADTANSGQLAGQSAVGFLTKSGLDFAILKQVWSIADTKKQNCLTRDEFYVAMRLIAMAQAAPGNPLSIERLKAEGSTSLLLARMQGVPAPPAGLSHSQGSGGGLLQGAGGGGGGGGGDPYAMSAMEKSKYEMLFPQYDVDGDGFVTGQEAAALFSKSGLPRQQLRQVWELADGDKDSKLTREEFCIGMHLIVCVSKRGLEVPARLPPSLSRGQTGMTTPGPSTPTAAGLAIQAPAQAMGAPSPASMTPAVPPSGPTLPSKPSAGSMGNALSDAFSGLSVALTKQAPEEHVPAPGVSPVPPGPRTEAQMPAPSPAMSVSSTPTAGGPSGGQGTMQPVGLMAAGSRASLGQGTGASPSGMQASETEVKELEAASSALLEVTKTAVAVNNQGVAAQQSSVESLRKLIQQLHAEKISLNSMLEASREEFEDNEKQLDAMSTEVASLQAELGRLRDRRQEEERSISELRAKVTMAAADRQKALAEMEGLKGSVENLEREKATLKEEVAASDMTRVALEGHSASLQDVKSQHTYDMSRDQPQPAQAAAAVLPSEPQPIMTPSPEPVAPVPTVPQVSVEASVGPENQASPEMPSELPPPVPPKAVPAMATEPAAATSDPFADVGGAPQVDAFDAFSSATQATGNAVAGESSEGGGTAGVSDGFDAFPASQDAFASDPFAADAFGAAGGGGTTSDSAGDPFAAAGNGFGTATDTDPFAGASGSGDGFDAFPTPSDASFDAFGQQS